MAKRKRTIRKPSAAEKAKLSAAIKEEGAGREENRKIGKRLQDNRAASIEHSVAHALQILQDLRSDQGVSLRQLEEKTGITAGNLSRMWNDPDPNVTVKTLDRIAIALGRKVRIGFDEVGS